MASRICFPYSRPHPPTPKRQENETRLIKDWQLLKLGEEVPYPDVFVCENSRNKR